MLRILLINDAKEKVQSYQELLKEYTELPPDLIEAVASVEDINLVLLNHTVVFPT